MLIPRFSLSQTSTHLSISIRCPYVKFSSGKDENGVEVDLLSGNDFYFACKPYYLHLYLPGRVIDKDQLDYRYDLETSSFCFTYAKENPNEHFENLDMLTRLLHQDEKKKKNNGIKTNQIEEIDVQTNEDEDEDDDEPLWNQMRQMEINDQVKEEPVISSSIYYGFNQQYKEVFSSFDSEYLLIFDNPSPDTLSMSSIRLSRLEKENEDFNLEHFLADKDEFDDEKTILDYSIDLDDELTDEDRDDLKNLKYKQFLIDDPIPIYLGLIDLLYAFVYDQRITQGDPCCESPWNIQKVSSTLSWFETFTDLPSVLIASARRTLTYPLIRSMKLVKKCFEDVQKIFLQDKRMILKCLLKMRRLFLDEEHRYLLNTLYLNDYCLWIQTDCQKKWLESLADAMKHWIKDEFNENLLEFDLNEKEVQWKINLCEQNDTDDDDDE